MVSYIKCLLTHMYIYKNLYQRSEANTLYKYIVLYYELWAPVNRNIQIGMSNVQDYGKYSLFDYNGQ